MTAWIALALAGIACLGAAIGLAFALIRLSSLRREVELARAAAAAAQEHAARKGGGQDEHPGDLAAELQSMKQLLHQVAVRLETGPSVQSRSEPLPAAGSWPQAPAGPGLSGSAMARDLAAEVQAAVDGNRVDVYLQPIVTLPQRQTWFMAATTCLRDGSGRVLPPAQVAPLVQRLGLAQELDNLLLLRCVQMVRRMKRRPRSVGLFCDIAAESLDDADFFAQFAEYLETDAELPDFLVFQITLAMLEAADEVQLLRLRHLTELGFRLSVNGVDSPRFSARELARDGISFVRLDIACLLPTEGLVPDGEGLAEEAEQDEDAETPESDWLAAFDSLRGEELVPIVDNVRHEAQVPPLLELGVPLAQGPLFGPARPAGTEP